MEHVVECCMFVLSWVVGCVMYDHMGFLYIWYVCVLFVLVIVRSKKFMLLFSSISSVNFNLWCIVLMYLWKFSICLLLPL